MVPQYAKAYRTVLRELHKASISPGRLNPALTSNFRAIFEKYRQSGDTRPLDGDIQNAITFLRSQREYKVLLERYNPLVDLTAEERIHATARRVGLDMPVTHKPESDH